MATIAGVRRDLLRRKMDDLYRHYDHRFVDPDPLEFVRRQTSAADREVVGLIASSLAYGNVRQIKRSIGRVLEALGDGAAAAIDRLEPRAMARRLAKFKHRFNDGRDVACLLFFIRQMRDAARLGRGLLPRRARRPRGRRRPRADLVHGAHPRPRSRRALRARRAARRRRRAVLLPLAGVGQRVQAAQPVPALDGAPRGRRPRRVARRGPAPASSSRSTRTCSPSRAACA